MKIYFCASIRGGREMRAHYESLIGLLKNHGTVLTEHIADVSEIPQAELSLTDREIYDQDVSWLEASDIVIAEVTQPSLGVGFEVGYALQLNKPILCLFRSSGEYKISAMISGCPQIQTIYYETLDQLEAPIKSFVGKSWV